MVDPFDQTSEDTPGSIISLDDLEREHIIRVLENTNWKIEGPNGAAKLLGLKPSTLRNRMAKLGIQRRVAAVF
jgi:transcriptional regulator with GAF, ATPase, and Fis domain